MALRFGSRGPDVLELQQLLNEQYDPPITENGVFDFPTKNMVIRYQGDQELVADGEAGNITVHLLRGGSLKIQVDVDPPERIQPTNQWVCWSEALSSFLDATHDSTQFTADSWVDIMRGRGFTGYNDGLVPAGWSNIMLSLGLKGKLFSDANQPVPALLHARSAFGADTLYNAIRDTGYQIVVFNLGDIGDGPSALAHTIVVWGIELNPGTDPHYIRVMDPWRVGKTTREFKYLANRSVVGLICKPAYHFTASANLPFLLPQNPYAP